MKVWKIIVPVLALAALFGAYVLVTYEGGESHAIVGHVSGKVSYVDFNDWSVRVGNSVVYLRGRYDCNGVIFYSEDMLQRIDGKNVDIGYSEDLGYPVAEEIAVDGVRCIRIPGRGSR